MNGRGRIATMMSNTCRLEITTRRSHSISKHFNKGQSQFPIILDLQRQDFSRGEISDQYGGEESQIRTVTELKTLEPSHTIDWTNITTHSCLETLEILRIRIMEHFQALILSNSTSTRPTHRTTGKISSMNLGHNSGRRKRRNIGGMNTQIQRSNQTTDIDERANIEL